MRPVVPAVHARCDITWHDGREHYLNALLVLPDEAAVASEFALHRAVCDDKQVKDSVGWTASAVVRHLGGRVRGKTQGICEADHIMLELCVNLVGTIKSTMVEGMAWRCDKMCLRRLYPASLCVLDAQSTVLYHWQEVPLVIGASASCSYLICNIKIGKIYRQS